MFDRARGRLQVARLTVIYWILVAWDLVLSIALFLVGFFLNSDVASWIVWALSFVTIVWPIYRGIVLFRSHHHNAVTVDFDNIRLDGPALNWKRFLWGREGAVFSSALNSRLGNSRNPLAISPENYRPSPDIYKLSPYILIRVKSGIQFDDMKVRLASDITEQSLISNKPMPIQRTKYFWGLCTNEMALRRIFLHSGNSTVQLDGRNLWIYEPDSTNALLSLAESPSLNHIGVSTLAITTAGKIPIVKQAQHPSQSQGLFAPSGSGSLDWRDVREVKRRKAETLQELILHGMGRELIEECNLKDGDLIGTYLVGHARLLHRGGKPDFFGLSILRDRKGLFKKISLSERKYIEILDPRPARHVAVDGGLDS